MSNSIRFILSRNYLLIKLKHSVKIFCREGRSCDINIDDTYDHTEYYYINRNDFLYEKSDTSITMCHLTFQGENLDDLELSQMDFPPRFDYINRIEFEKHLKDFENHKTDFETAKVENTKAHEDLKKLINKNLNFISLFYEDLKKLRDNSKLTAGTWYKIIDYTCVLKKSDDISLKSAGHSFCILVFATSENTLSETAFAYKPTKTITEVIYLNKDEISYTIENPDYEYFQNCNFEAWELRYCLDNDQTRFSYVASDDEGGKGWIYYMKDENNNEADYDFKNLMACRYEITASELSDFSFSEYRYFTALTTTPYWTISTENHLYFYTFSFCNSTELKQNTIYDASVSSYKDCITNNSLLTGLPISVFICCGKDKVVIVNINNNTLKKDCISNTFNGECIGNTFEFKCQNNVFGNSLYYNSFDSNCFYNYIGDSFSYNKLDKGVYENHFYKLQHSIINSKCHNNTFVFISVKAIINLRYLFFHSNFFAGKITFNAASATLSYFYFQYIEFHTFNTTATSNELSISVSNQKYKINVYVDSDGNNTQNTLGY